MNINTLQKAPSKHHIAFRQTHTPAPMSPNEAAMNHGKVPGFNTTHEARKISSKTVAQSVKYPYLCAMKRTLQF